MNYVPLLIIIPSDLVPNKRKKCKFATEYWNHERQAKEHWNCDSKDEDVLDSGKCIFHDENYIKVTQDSLRREEKSNVRGVYYVSLITA